MARRDQLTYDLGDRDAQPLPWRSLALLAAVVAAALALLTWVLLSGSGPSAAPAPAPSSSTVTPSGPSTGITASAAPPGTPSPTPVGSDAVDGLPVPEGSDQAAARFVRAWLDPDPKTRAPALKEVAAPALAEQLMLTDPANVPQATPRGAPVLAGASTYSAEFTQTLSTGQRIQVYLVAEPTARYRWVTTSVEQA